MKRYAVTAAIIGTGLLSGVALAACGGDDTPETPIVVTTSAESLTKEEFIAQADAICDETNSQIQAIADAGEGITRANDVADLRQAMLTDIQDLGAPAEDTSSTSTDSSSTDPTSTIESEDTSTFPGDETDTGATGTGAADTPELGTDATDTTGTDTEALSTDSDTAATGTGTDLDNFYAALQAQVEAGKKIGLASQRGESTVEAEAELEDAKSQAAEAAGAYGFEVCGTSGTSSTSTGTDSGTDSSSGTAAPVVPSEPAPVAPSGGADSGSDSGSSDGGVSPGAGGVGPG
jgi:hypothetical protein